MQVTNTAEGGSNGTTITTGNSGGSSGDAWDAVTIGTTGVVAYSTAQAINPSTVSMRVASGGTAAQAFMEWLTATLGSPTRVYGRAYFRLAAVGVSRELLRWRRLGTQIARLRVDSSNVLELRQGNNSAPATSGGTGTVTLSANTWYRVEWDIRAGTLTNTIYLYSGHSTTPLETITGNGVFSTTGAVSEFAAGQFTATASLGDLFLDGLMLNDTDLPGPLLVSAAVAESLTLGNAITRSLALPRAVAESLTLGNSISAGVALARAIPESLTLTDASARNVARIAAIAESLGLSDAVATQIDRPTAAAAALGLADAVARTVVLPRAQGETLGLADSAGQNAAQARAVAETLGLAGAAARTTATVVGVAEAVTVSDAWSYIVSRSAAAAAALGLADSAARQYAAVRGVDEALGLADSMFAGVGVTIGFSETLTLDDTLGRAVSKARALGEGLTLDASSARIVALVCGVDEELGVDVESTADRVVLVAVDESLTLDATATRAAVDYSRGVAESLTMSAGMARQVSRDRAAAETLGLAAAWVCFRFALVTMSETLTLEASAARAATSVARAVAETLGLGNAVGRQVSRPRAVAEALGLADEWLAARQILPVSAAVEISFSGNVAVVRALSRQAAQTVTLSSAAGRSINRARGLPESVTVADLMKAIRGQHLGVSSQITLDDRADAVIARARAIVEQIQFGDFASVGGAGGQLVIAHEHRIRMSGPTGRIRFSTPQAGTVRRTV